MSGHKPGTQRVTCITHQWGQPGPYADHVFDFEIVVEWIPSYGPDRSEFQPRDIQEDFAIQLAKGFVPFKTEDENPEWHETRLVKWTRLAPGNFRFEAVREFTD